MAREGIAEEPAFTMLVALGQQEQKSIREVAHGLVNSTTRRGR